MPNAIIFPNFSQQNKIDFYTVLSVFYRAFKISLPHLFKRHVSVCIVFRAYNKTETFFFVLFCFMNKYQSMTSIEYIFIYRLFPSFIHSGLIFISPAFCTSKITKKNLFTVNKMWTWIVITWIIVVDINNQMIH